jgi:hypothetical protein
MRVKVWLSRSDLSCRISECIAFNTWAEIKGRGPGVYSLTWPGLRTKIFLTGSYTETGTELWSRNTKFSLTASCSSSPARTDSAPAQSMISAQVWHRFAHG